MKHSFEGVVFSPLFAPTAEFGAVFGEDFFEFDAVEEVQAIDAFQGGKHGGETFDVTDKLSPCESAVAVDEGEEVVSLALVDEEVFSQVVAVYYVLAVLLSV